MDGEGGNKRRRIQEEDDEEEEKQNSSHVSDPPTQERSPSPPPARRRRGYQEPVDDEDRLTDDGVSGTWIVGISRIYFMSVPVGVVSLGCLCLRETGKLVLLCLKGFFFVFFY